MPHLKFLPKALKIVELALYPNYPLKESHKLSTTKNTKNKNNQELANTAKGYIL